MELKPRKSLLLALVAALACCTTILALDERQHTRPQQPSSHLQRPSQQQQQQRLRLPRRLSSLRHNDLASTEPSKKTTSSSSTHMPAGGHLRTEAVDSTTMTTTSKPVDPTLDDGLLLSSAGNGKEKKPTTKSTDCDDEEKKTLSQQVKEGKYGLIQNEIFPSRPKRPGVISYSTNPEVPGDTAKNFGGLDEDEIWLAENHVLVLKGGKFRESASPEENTDLRGPDVISWPPIDDYNAPRRQVKIPPRPKVPPPFPVQLLEHGPIELIGTNGSILAENGTIDFEALPGGFRGFLPGEGPYFPFPVGKNSQSVDAPSERKTKSEGAPGPFYPALPPGAVIVPPPSNQTDYDDEDQSVYYPPPYSFVYPQDNSTAIPPGPLVPGIILPPPPDFFSSLLDDTTAVKKPTSKDQLVNQRPITTPQPSYPPGRKSSTKLYKTPSVTSAPLGSKTASYNPKPFSRAKVQKNSTYHHHHHHQYQIEKTTPRPFVEVATPVPVKSTTLETPDKYIQQILSNQVIETSTEKPAWKSAVSSKAQVPLVTFFATTTPSSVDEPVETTPSSVKDVLTTESPTRYPSQASYYFYEESSNEESSTPASTPAPLVYFSTTAESPPYYKLELPVQQPQQPAEGDKKDYYDVEMIPSQQTAKEYNVKLIDTMVKDPQIFRYLDSGATSSQDKYESSPVVRSQSPRLLHSQEPLYYQPIVPQRSSSKLNYFSTPKPKSYYHRPEIGDGFEFAKPSAAGGHRSKPIYQYSFEATNYAKRSRPSLLSQKPVVLQEQQIQQPRRQKELNIFNEYQNIQSVGNDQYDYEGGSEPVADQQVQTEKVPYLVTPQKKERAYYQQSTTAAPLRGTTLAGHRQYFTKQDEQLLDEVTKEYFTMFGKKLQSTTPIYGKSSVTERPPSYSSANGYGAHEYTARQPSAFRPSPNIKVHYGDHTPGPYSLADDILVNYKQPLPAISREAEFLPTPPQQLLRKYAPPRPLLQVNPQLRDYSLGGQQRFDQRGYAQQANSFVPIADPRETIRGAGGYPPRPISLEGDIAVNYKHPRPPINPDAEFIGNGAAGLGAPSRVDANVDKPSSYFAYRLPGDGGHFYFLAPQPINRDDNEADGYLYSRPRGSGLLRRRRGRDSG